MATLRTSEERFFNSRINIVGFNSYLFDYPIVPPWPYGGTPPADYNEGAPMDPASLFLLQGWGKDNTNGFVDWEYYNSADGNGDPDTGLSYMKCNDQGPDNPMVRRGINSDTWSQALSFGFELDTIFRPKGPGATWVSWDRPRDPRVDKSYYFASNNNTTTQTFMTLRQYAGEIVVSKDGVFSIDYQSFDGGSLPCPILSSSEVGGSSTVIREANVGGSLVVQLQVWHEGLLRTADDWIVPGAGSGSPSTITMTRTVGTGAESGKFFVTPTIAGVVKTRVEVTDKDFTFSLLGKTVSNAGVPEDTYSQGIAYTNLSIQETTTDPAVLEYSLLDVGNRQLSNNMAESSLWLIDPYDPNQWLGSLGTESRLLVLFDLDDTTDPANPVFEVNIQGDTPYKHTIPVPSNEEFVNVRIQVAPSPDLVNRTWGNLRILVDGVDSGVDIAPADWIDTGSDNYSRFQLGSGSGGGVGRECDYVSHQLVVAQDARQYSIDSRGFDVNAIGGILGTNEATVTIPEDARFSLPGSLVEVTLLDNTPLTVTCNGSDLVNGATFVEINKSGLAPELQGIKRILLVKESNAHTDPAILSTYNAIFLKGD